MAMTSALAASSLRAFSNSSIAAPALLACRKRSACSRYCEISAVLASLGVSCSMTLWVVSISKSAIAGEASPSAVSLVVARMRSSAPSTELAGCACVLRAWMRACAFWAARSQVHSVRACLAARRPLARALSRCLNTHCMRSAKALGSGSKSQPSFTSSIWPIHGLVALRVAGMR